MRRLAALGVLLALAAALAPLAWGAAPPRSWAQAEIDTVVRAGVMGADAQSFRPDDPLTQNDLGDLIGTLTGQPVAAGFTARPVTIAALDRQLVDALGLGPAAQQLAQSARAAGLSVPARFGTELVARLLGLRVNHPARQDALELLPGDTATRAEAAY